MHPDLRGEIYWEHESNEFSEMSLNAVYIFAMENEWFLTDKLGKVGSFIVLPYSNNTDNPSNERGVWTGFWKDGWNTNERPPRKNNNFIFDESSIELRNDFADERPTPSPSIAKNSEPTTAETTSSDTTTSFDASSVAKNASEQTSTVGTDPISTIISNTPTSALTSVVKSCF